MSKRPIEVDLKRHWKTHAFSAGMTLALAAPLLQQGCALSGQCASCGACAVRAPLLALPLLLDAGIVLGERVWRTVVGGEAGDASTGQTDSDEEEVVPG
jgi:hypothetical protein